MAINGQAAGDVSHVHCKQVHLSPGLQTRLVSLSDEMRARQSWERSGATRLLLAVFNGGRAMTLSDAMPADWRHELALNGSIGGSVLA